MELKPLFLTFVCVAFLFTRNENKTSDKRARTTTYAMKVPQLSPATRIWGVAVAIAATIVDNSTVNKRFIFFFKDFGITPTVKLCFFLIFSNCRGQRLSHASRNISWGREREKGKKEEKKLWFMRARCTRQSCSKFVHHHHHQLFFFSSSAFFLLTTQT